jgi:hypothetical protein
MTYDMAVGGATGGGPWTPPEDRGAAGRGARCAAMRCCQCCTAKYEVNKRLAKRQTKHQTPTPNTKQPAASSSPQPTAQSAVVSAQPRGPRAKRPRPRPIPRPRPHSKHQISKDPAQWQARFYVLRSRDWAFFFWGGAPPLHFCAISISHITAPSHIYGRMKPASPYLHRRS